LYKTSDAKWEEIAPNKYRFDYGDDKYFAQVIASGYGYTNNFKAQLFDHTKRGPVEEESFDTLEKAKRWGHTHLDAYLDEQLGGHPDSNSLSNWSTRHFHSNKGKIDNMSSLRKNAAGTMNPSFNTDDAVSVPPFSRGDIVTPEEAEGQMIDETGDSGVLDDNLGPDNDIDSEVIKAVTEGIMQAVMDAASDLDQDDLVDNNPIPVLQGEPQVGGESPQMPAGAGVTTSLSPSNSSRKAAKGGYSTEKFERDENGNKIVVFGVSHGLAYSVYMINPDRFVYEIWPNYDGGDSEDGPDPTQVYDQGDASTFDEAYDAMKGSLAGLIQDEDKSPHEDERYPGGVPDERQRAASKKTAAGEKFEAGIEYEGANYENSGEKDAKYVVKWIADELGLYGYDDSEASQIGKKLVNNADFSDYAQDDNTFRFQDETGEIGIWCIRVASKKK
jgi:hypothetical protein